MRIFKIFFSLIVSLILVIGVNPKTSYAATGNQGYAAYRDGVLLGSTWHAAIQMNPYMYGNWTDFAEAVGPGYSAQCVDYSTFLGGHNPMGVYTNTSATSANLDNIVWYASELAHNYTVSYSAVSQTSYGASKRDSQWIYLDELTGIRCDGVVEFCYEWYNVKVCYKYINQIGRVVWDITNRNDASWHNGGGFYPDTQAKQFLTYKGAIR